MTADIQQLMEVAINLNLLWSAPFQILLTVVFLWQELGSSVLAGIGVLLLVLPINTFFAAKMKQFRVRNFNGRTVPHCFIGRHASQFEWGVYWVMQAKFKL